MVPRNEQTLVVLILLGILGVILYRLLRWLTSGARTAEPWGAEIEESLNREDAVPICHHCLTPQEHNGWFCPQCGATVGPYCNYLPFVYLFAEGEVLRAGVTEHFRRRPIIVIGYILFSITQFFVAAPVYWFFLFRNLRRPDTSLSQAPPETPPVPS